MGVELAEAVAADLKKVGIEADIEVFDWATMVQFWAGLPPEKNPQEIFMIEGHTDTVGSDAANLALSDRRAESVALALTEYFDVPPENLVTQGYGEQFLRVRAEGDIRDNRRASVRRITDLLAQ